MLMILFLLNFTFKMKLLLEIILLLIFSLTGKFVKPVYFLSSNTSILYLPGIITLQLPSTHTAILLCDLAWFGISSFNGQTIIKDFNHLYFGRSKADMISIQIISGV